MELTIIDINFHVYDKDWMYKLTDKSNDIFLIPMTEFYEQNGLKSPIGKNHLDAFDKGVVVDVETGWFGGQKIVTKILSYYLPNAGN
jgi:hypothetical protein